MGEIQKEKELILEQTAKEYFLSGEEEMNKERNNSAVVLFFKSLLALADLLIYRVSGNTPSSHSDRFSLAKKNLPELYKLLDKDFPFYQDSYNILRSKELVEVIKEDAEKVAKEIGIRV